WPAVALLVIAPIVFESTSLTAVPFLVLLAITLVPVASRLLDRELAVGASVPLAAAGVAMLVAGTAASIMLVAGLFLGFSEQPTLGVVVAQAQQELFDTPRPLAVPAIAFTLMLLAFNLLGAGLLARARTVAGAASLPAPTPPPVTPTQSAVSAEPTVPVVPAQPGVPVAPAPPAVPSATPAQPAVPVEPAVPVAPVEPGVPTSVAPADPSPGPSGDPAAAPGDGPGPVLDPAAFPPPSGDPRPPEPSS
ncbi:MAG: hypothetical protein AAGK32_12590, partial [Actinomycetota bacterium]